MSAISSTGTDRRLARRVTFMTAVGGDLGGRHVLDYTSDISLGGLYLRTTKLNGEPGAPIKLTLRLPGMAARVTIDGVVVRFDCGEDGGVAVRFTSLPADLDAAIGKLTGEQVATADPSPIESVESVESVEDTDVIAG